MDGDMCQEWEHVVGCGGMWQGMGTCHMGGGRVWGHVAGVWGHVAGVWICHRGSGLVHGRRHVAGVGTCGRVWGHVAGCGALVQLSTSGRAALHKRSCCSTSARAVCEQATIVELTHDPL